MFDNAKTTKNVRRQHEIISAEMKGQLDRGNFLLTSILAELDPIRYFALSIMDGQWFTKEIDGGHVAEAYEESWPLPPVRLVLVPSLAKASGVFSGTPASDSKRGEIKGREPAILVKRRRRERLPGTDGTDEDRHYRMTTTWENHGTDAVLSSRDARQVLIRDGYPVRDSSSGNMVKGFIVEYEWLKREVERDDCQPEFKRAWQEIEALQNEQPKTRTKRPATGAEAQQLPGT